MAGTMVVGDGGRYCLRNVLHSRGRREVTFETASRRASGLCVNSRLATWANLPIDVKRSTGTPRKDIASRFARD